MSFYKPGVTVLLAVAAPPGSRVGISRVIDAEPQIRCLIFQLWLEGCTAHCCASWQRGTVTGSSLIKQGGLAARMGLRTSLRRRAVRVLRLEDAMANGRRSWPVFQFLRKIPRSRRRRGVRANISSEDFPSSASSASTSARGFSARLMLGEGLRGATRSLAMFFGHVL